MFPPTAVVPIADIGTTINGSTHDTAWRYSFSGEVGPPPPDPTPDPTPSPVTPTTPASTPASETSALGAMPLPGVLGGQWTRPSKTGVVRVGGSVPTGTTLVTQTAELLRPARERTTRGVIQMAVSTSRRGTCAIAGTAYRCAIRLAPGRWVITTSALGPAGVLALSTHRVAVARTAGGVPVTG